MQNFPLVGLFRPFNLNWNMRAWKWMAGDRSFRQLILNWNMRAWNCCGLKIQRKFLNGCAIVRYVHFVLIFNLFENQFPCARKALVGMNLNVSENRFWPSLMFCLSERTAAFLR